jgi:hypothetical protein
MAGFLAKVRLLAKGYLGRVYKAYIQVLENGDDLLQGKRKHLLGLLSRLTESAQVYPNAYELSGVKCDLNIYCAVDGGGFGVIYRGTLGERTVCVKVARVTQRDISLNNKYVEVSLARIHLC